MLDIIAAHRFPNWFPMSGCLFMMRLHKYTTFPRIFFVVLVFLFIFALKMSNIQIVQQKGALPDTGSDMEKRFNKCMQ